MWPQTHNRQQVAGDCILSNLNQERKKERKNLERVCIHMDGQQYSLKVLPLSILSSQVIQSAEDSKPPGHPREHQVDPSHA